MIDKLFKKYKELPAEIKASFWFLISSFFQRGISVITTPIFTRIMSTNEYGEFSVFYSWYGIITIIVTFNLFYGVYIRGLVTYDNEKEKFTSAMQGLMLTLVVIWFVVYLIFKKYINNILNITTFQMICMFLIIWTTGVYNFWAAYQRVALSYIKLVSLSMITSVVSPIVQIVIMNFESDKVNARIIGILIVNFCFYFVLFWKQIESGKIFYDKKIWKYALSFNIPLIPHYLSQTVLNSSDRIMIGKMVGAEQAGIYSLAYSISQIMSIFNVALMQTIEPWLYKKIKNDETNSIKKIAYPAFALVAIVNLILIALAPEIVRFFAPTEYYNAIWIIPPVAMSVFFMFTYTFFAVFEFYFKKTQYITIATLIGAVINIVLNYIFIGVYGYYAAGYTTLFCYILYSLFHYIFMKKIIKDYLENKQIYNGKLILGIIVLFVLSGYLLMITYKMPVIRYGLVFVIAFIILINFKNIVTFIKKIMAERK